MQGFVRVEREKAVTIVVDNAKSKASLARGQSTSHDYMKFPIFDRLLESLTQFCIEPVSTALLLGPKSSGKSTLLSMFKKTHASCYHLQHCRGKVDFVASFINTPLAIEDGQMPENCFGHLKRLVGMTGNTIFLVDHAENLGADDLHTIYSFLASTPNPPFKIIFAGASSLQQRIEKIMEHTEIRIAYKTLLLTPLSMTETKGYLNHYFNHLALDKQKLLTSKVLEEIYNRSKGYPGRINRVVSQLAAELSVGKGVIKKRRNVSLVDFFIITTITMLLFVFGQQLLKTILEDQPVTGKYGKSKQTALVASHRNEEDFQSYIASIENVPEEKIELNLSSPEVVLLPEPVRLVSIKKKSQ